MIPSVTLKRARKSLLVAALGEPGSLVIKGRNGHQMAPGSGGWVASRREKHVWQLLQLLLLFVQHNLSGSSTNFVPRRHFADQRARGLSTRCLDGRIHTCGFAELPCCITHFSLCCSASCTASLELRTFHSSSVPETRRRWHPTSTAMILTSGSGDTAN
jgi:hypothetical protein